jgi:hypothetical protein
MQTGSSEENFATYWLKRVDSERNLELLKESALEFFLGTSLFYYKSEDLTNVWY